MDDFKTTPIFDKNLRLYVLGYRHIINQGGARSSKTYSILQLLYQIAERSKEPLLISVVSESLPHLRRGAIRDFKTFLQASGLWVDDNWSKSEFIYKVNHSIIEFFSCDISGKVHGPSRDILFINECNRVDFDTAQQLMIRTKRSCFYDFNPVSEFWVHTEIKPRSDAGYIRSTYKDNNYLDQTIVSELIQAGERNKNFKRVYIDGEIGEIEGAVFTNWDIGAFDESLQFGFGQDFGFSSDPTTLIKCAIDEKRKLIYLHECYCKPGLSTKEIFDLNSHYCNNGLIVADSAEPRLINELYRMGLNIHPCEKGQGSVTAGLLGMLDYKIIVTPESANLARELKSYIWLDNSSKLVIDDFNHCIDAARYIFKKLKGNNFFVI